MNPSTKKLLSIAGSSIGAHEAREDFLANWGPLGRELADLLALRNGFYVYESALLVRPLRNEDAPLGLAEWNVPSLWKSRYVGGIADALFFAEDAFGAQFCILEGNVCAFDPETEALERLWHSIDEWAGSIIFEPSLRTGFPLAQAWQRANRPLLPGERLLPKTPFVLGGNYAVENLYPLQDVRGMLFRASIASQIRDLPDGSQVIIKISESPPTPNSKVSS